MNLQEIIQVFNLKVFTCKDNLNKDVEGGYVSDLLSDVLADAKTNQIWITLQTHKNIVAIAQLKGLSTIVLVKGLEPNENTIQKAEEERIFNAIRPAAKNSDIIKQREHITGVICNSQNAGLGNILQYFVTWELFHYINGKCNFNAQRLEAKIRWFLEHSKNQIPQ